MHSTVFGQREGGREAEREREGERQRERERGRERQTDRDRKLPTERLTQRFYAQLIKRNPAGPKKQQQPTATYSTRERAIHAILSSLDPCTAIRASENSRHCYCSR